jgi:hypothetical protein
MPAYRQREESYREGHLRYRWLGVTCVAVVEVRHNVWLMGTIG